MSNLEGTLHQHCFIPWLPADHPAATLFPVEIIASSRTAKVQGRLGGKLVYFQA